MTYFSPLPKDLERMREEITPEQLIELEEYRRKLKLNLDLVSKELGRMIDENLGVEWVIEIFREFQRVDNITERITSITGIYMDCLQYFRYKIKELENKIKELESK